MPTALPVILFDDGRGQLSPLTDLRPAFDVRVGALTVLERITLLTSKPPAGLIVPPHLEAICREKWPGVPVNQTERLKGECLLLNGRWSGVCGDAMREIDQGGAVVEADDELLGADPEVEDIERLIARECKPSDERSLFEALPAGSRTLRRPWDARRLRDHTIAVDLSLLLWANRQQIVIPPITSAFCSELLSKDLGALFKGNPNPIRLAPGVIAFGDKGLAIAPTARLSPSVVLDCESGPIVIADHAMIRPGAIITGPAYIGPHSTVLDRAVIRGNTAIGPHCKVAGEVSGTVFQGYANKAHDGFLGDSWVGEWVNLGAGTTNSNLLNTYSEIICRATPDGPNERTGETFLGAIIGDHVKTAICTRIMTGSILHTGSMFATTAPVSGTIGRFTWATDAGSRTYRFDKFLDVARAAMARRKLEPSAAYIERLRALAEAGKQPG